MQWDGNLHAHCAEAWSFQIAGAVMTYTSDHVVLLGTGFISGTEDVDGTFAKGTLRRV